MKIRLDKEEEPRHFGISGIYFEGVIRSGIFTVQKVVFDRRRLSCPSIELNKPYIMKIIDRGRKLLSYEKKFIKRRGIEYID